MHTALKSGDKIRTETLRFLIAAVKKYQIDAYPPGSVSTLTDRDVLRIIGKQVKTHKESIMAFKNADRHELQHKEEAELAILAGFLPAEMSDVEIRSVVKKVIASGGVNFGQVMGIVMKELKGKADGSRVQQFVKEELK